MLVYMYQSEVQNAVNLDYLANICSILYAGAIVVTATLSFPIIRMLLKILKASD